MAAPASRDGYMRACCTLSNPTLTAHRASMHGRSVSQVQVRLRAVGQVASWAAYFV